MGKDAVKGASQLGRVAWKSRTQAKGKADLAVQNGPHALCKQPFLGVYEVRERSPLKFGPQKNAKILSFPRIEPSLPNL